MFTQMGTDAVRKFYLEESYALVIGFPTAATDLVSGQQVTLGTNGQVSRITSATQFPLGPLASTYQGNDKGVVRVYTPFVVVKEQENAAAAINASTLLASTGVDANGNTTWAAATTGQYASGMALTTSTGANTPITVGVFRVTLRVP